MKTYSIIALVLVISCTGPKDTKLADEQVHVETHKENTLVLTPMQIETIKLKTGHITDRNLKSVVKANGYLDVPPQNKAVISPMITGYVKKINFLVGDNVRKGQTMIELESMDFIGLQQQYLEQKANEAYLKEEFDRQKLLSDQNATAKKKLLSAQAEYQIASSALQGTKSKLQLLGADLSSLDNGQFDKILKLKAPISGSVKSLNAVLGKHVDTTEELFAIVNPDHLHLELSVYEKDIHKIKHGQKVRFSLPSLDGMEHEGEVYLVGQDLSESKRSINIHVHIEEEPGFSVGMYANASIETSESLSPTLPVNALVVNGNDNFIFKKTNETSNAITFEKIRITAGAESEGYIEILQQDGLGSDDEIVTDGAFYLLNAFSEGDHGH